MAHFEHGGGGGRNILAELSELANSARPFTDIRLETDATIAVRMPDGWTELDEYEPTTWEDLSTIMKSIDPDWEELIQKGAINRPYDLTRWRLRINGYLGYGGKKLMIAIRRLPIIPTPLSKTGLPSIVRVMLQAPRGLILISGATGSGKSTTTAALVDNINEQRKAHIITIEDPIEYVYVKNKSIFSQREIGVDTRTFADGLRDAMRQRPDVIVVGEIRDRDTAETALLASESGHLVIGTIHANTAIGATQKILQFFNDSERNSKTGSLASTLVGVINQILLPTQDRSGYALAAEVLNNSEQDFSGAIGDPVKLTGLLENRDIRRGSVSMAESLADLVSKGMISKLDASLAVVGMPGVQERLKVLLR